MPSSGGALLTWQTTLGRGGDPVQNWIQHGITADMVSELTQGDSFCQEWFERFRATVVSYVERHGVQHWACCVELSPDQQNAIVHVHAYVAPSWPPLPNGEKRKVKIVPEDWVYEGFRPNVKGALVRRNACVKKVLAAGFFYCSAKKIGSVFRASSLTPGKDWCSARFAALADIAAPLSACFAQSFPRVLSAVRRDRKYFGSAASGLRS